MLDIKVIRDQPERVRERLAARGWGEAAAFLEELLLLDQQRRRQLAKVEQLKARRNQISKQIGALMAQKKAGEAEELKREGMSIGEEVASLDQEVAAIDRKREDLLLQIPNLPDSSVPLGKTSEENRVVRLWGDKPALAFGPKTHVELCESLGLVDFERGAKLAGRGFVLYTGRGARLERALIQFLLDVQTGEHGYTEVIPPFMVNRACMTGTGHLPKFEDQAYAVREGTDDSTLGQLFLVPTAEAPVANIHREEILKEEQLPVYYCAYTPCFRAEAGAAGVGTRGLIRVHQFDKVELIKIVDPEKGYAELERMVQDAENILRRLGLHYRVVELCTGDIGFASAKTYDLEVWAPGQGQYLEVSSCSNTEEFQARRMQLRYKSRSGENRFPHILNGSGTALARLFVALLENYQEPDGSVFIPEALQPYLKAERISIAR